MNISGSFVLGFVFTAATERWATRPVAHVAKRFRDRGIAYSDLLQEGFCGLLEAIDRFDLTHETKLATYATWWIRQSMQRAVASGAYPVRLSPRHLRQLAQNQDELDRGRAGRSGRPRTARPAGSTEMIHRIHAATRPTVSLDATLDADIELQPAPDDERPRGRPDRRRRHGRGRRQADGRPPAPRAAGPGAPVRPRRASRGSRSARSARSSTSPRSGSARSRTAPSRSSAPSAVEQNLGRLAPGSSV